MTYQEKYQNWKENVFFDLKTREELAVLSPVVDKKEIEDRFYQDLTFGTGGMRGLMGAGTNRMNRYTIGRAAAGYAAYLLANHTPQDCKKTGVVIAYDTRNNSAAFARAAADAMTALGGAVQLSVAPIPTPALSFAVRQLGALGGIVITASHNPKEYNGFKVYDASGTQLVPAQAKQVIAAVNAITDYTTVSFAGKSALLHQIDCTDAFVGAVLAQSLYHDAAAKAALRVVYTPLHGAGNLPVRCTLAAGGFRGLCVVPNQACPDGDFPTVHSPNPEEQTALASGIALAAQQGADIVLGTDPDCDRVGVGVRDANGGYQLLTGNQIGALLLDYLLSHIDIAAVKNPAVVSTVVSGGLAMEIAKKYGIAVFRTLTGFKFIGEKITQFEQAASTGDASRAYTFLFGYEESCGYLAGTHARDKDAVVSCLLLCEMAAEYKAQGSSLLQRLAQLHAEYGYHAEQLDSVTLRGKAGAAQISAMMQNLRTQGAPFADVCETIDYQIATPAEHGFGNLPSSNVLKYTMADGSWVAVRPSGTEPKMKIYYGTKTKNAAAAKVRQHELRSTIQTRLGIAQ